MSLLFAQARSQFDANMLNSFIRMMGVYPAGSVVQLTDDRYALVMSVNSTRPLKPNVMVHDPLLPREEALHLNLMTTPELGIRRSLKPAQLPADALDYLAPRPRVAYFFEAARASVAPEEEMVQRMTCVAASPGGTDQALLQAWARCLSTACPTPPGSSTRTAAAWSPTTRPHASCWARLAAACWGCRPRH